ncbi:hypothetical protein [Streptomyces sp. PvR034]|uniref:hypothetical protein n=1 Tax=Streptomyces sp. PvR034 TaxID=3156401 RepID=UPI00339299FD
MQLSEAIMKALGRSRRVKRGAVYRRGVGPVVAVAVSVMLMGSVSTCENNSPPSSDSTPPKIYILKFEKSGAGRGVQTTVNSGGQFEVGAYWLGESKADIRVYADDDSGSKWATVTSAFSGKCSSKPGPDGVSYIGQGLLSGNFPDQRQDAPSGSVRESFVFHLDKLIEDETDCGWYKFANMPDKRQFFAYGGTWNITAVAENCCGGRTTATFKIVVPIT